MPTLVSGIEYNHPIFIMLIIFSYFLIKVYTPNVDENAGPNTLVTTVVASDKDGDGVTFGFVGGTTTSGLFRIEENTGNH